jgi:recombination protein RecA
MGVDLKAIMTIKAMIEKKYKNSTELFPDFTKKRKIEVIRTKSSILNAITTIGGVPRGRVTQIYGPESTGKTTIGTELAIDAIKQAPDKSVLFLDFEHALDPFYAYRLGLDVNGSNFIYAQPDYFEQGEDIMYSLLNDSKMLPLDLLSLVIIDSEAAMTPRDILEGKAGDSNRIGLQAQLMSNLLAKTTKFISRGSKPALVLLNQTRSKIDVNNPRNNGEDAAGGKATKFYSSIRIKLELLKQEGDKKEQGDRNVGTSQVYNRHRVGMTVVKNKLGVPWVRGSLVFEFGKGINHTVSIAEMAEQKLGIMSGAGFFRYAGDTPATTFSCRGREEFQSILEGSPALTRELETKVIAKMEADFAQALGIKSGHFEEAGTAKEMEADITLEDDGVGLRAPYVPPFALAGGDGIPAGVGASMPTEDIE